MLRMMKLDLASGESNNIEKFPRKSSDYDDASAPNAGPRLGHLESAFPAVLQRHGGGATHSLQLDRTPDAGHSSGAPILE